MKILIGLLLIIFALGCTSTMQSVGKGDNIAVDYTGTLEDGNVFDSSTGRAPLEFEAGAGEMIKGFDDAVIGMKLNEEKNATIKPEDAYGKSDPVKVVTINTDSLEQVTGTKPKPGMVLYNHQGQQGVVISVVLNETKVDFNHPLAGKALNFRIIMKRIDKKGG